MAQRELERESAAAPIVWECVCLFSHYSYLSVSLITFLRSECSFISDINFYSLFIPPLYMYMRALFSWQHYVYSAGYRICRQEASRAMTSLMQLSWYITRQLITFLLPSHPFQLFHCARVLRASPAPPHRVRAARWTLICFIKPLCSPLRLSWPRALWFSDGVKVWRW